jgi:hypothetical protein
MPLRKLLYTLYFKRTVPPNMFELLISPTYYDTVVKPLEKDWELPAAKSVHVLLEPEVPWHSYDPMLTQYSSACKADGNPGP